MNMLSQINNPHILKVYGNNEDYNFHYLELEYCLTGDLSKALMLNRQVSWIIMLV